MSIVDNANLLEHIAKLERENIALKTELGKFQERLEREKIAEVELVKANDALARASARLAENPDLSSFLGYITQEAMSQLNANGSHLILFDEKKKVLSTAVLVENDGIIQETLIASEMPAEEAGFHKILFETQKPRFFDIETEEHLFWSGSIAYLRDRSLKQVLALPLLAGGKLFGHLAMAFINNDLISKQKIELLQALGHQAALAIQLTNLAEEAKQGAIAHERERSAEIRANELTHANQAMQRVLALTAKKTSLDSLLGDVLQAIAEQFDAPIVEWWESIDERKVAKRLSYLNGQIFSEEDLQGHHGVPSFTAIPETLHMESMTDRQKYVLVEDIEKLPYAPEEIDKIRAWYVKNGTQKFLNVPVIVEDRSIGGLLIFFPAHRHFLESQIEFGFAMARLLGLAIVVSRQAEVAKQVAIAREYEKVNQERSAQIERINSALNKSLQQLASKRNISHFLVDLLVALSENISAAHAMLFTFDMSAKTAEIIASVEGGIPYINSESRDPFPQKGCESENITWLLEAFSINKEILFLNSLEPIGIIPEVIEWHSRMRHQEIAAIPLIAGKNLIGMLGFAFKEKPNLSSFEIEFVNSLASQATLALQLILLAEESKQLAIAVERKRAAEARVTQLSKANTALKQTLDVLAMEPELERSLGHVLRVTSEQLDSPSSALWLYEPISDTFTIHTAYLNGKIVPATHENAPLLSGIWIRGRDLSGDLFLKKHIYDRIPVIYQVDELSDISRPFCRNMERLGVKTLLGIPLILGSSIIGSFTVRFNKKRSIDREDLELTQALAHQATLAIQMLHMAEEAKQVALYSERNRLAGEIHDSLAQAFTSISIQLGVAKWMLQQDQSTTESILDRINDIAQTGLAEARRSVWEIYPTAQDYSNLTEKISLCVENLTCDTSIKVNMQVVGHSSLVSPIIGYNLLKLTQEAITNSLKYSRASTISIILTYTEQVVSLSVIDDGCGFEPQRDSGGFGILSMSERADRLDGQFTINSSLGLGTEVRVEVPIK